MIGRIQDAIRVQQAWSSSLRMKESFSEGIYLEKIKLKQIKYNNKIKIRLNMTRGK